MITTREFWKGAAERLVKTFVQAFLAAALVGGVDAAAGLGITELNWLGALNVAGLAAFISLCTSVLNAQFTAGVPQPQGGELPPRLADPGRRVELDPPVV